MIKVIEVSNSTYFGGVSVVVTGVPANQIKVNVGHRITMRDKKTGLKYVTFFQANCTLTRDQILKEHLKKHPKARRYKGCLLEVISVDRAVSTQSGYEPLEKTWTYDLIADEKKWTQFPNNAVSGKPSWIEDGYGDDFVQQMASFGYQLEGKYFIN